MNETVAPEQIAADLNAAADDIERVGWARWEYEDDNGCHCISGALNLVITGDPNAWPDQDPRQYAAKGAFWHTNGQQPIIFNEQAEDGDEAVAALRRAAVEVLR